MPTKKATRQHNIALEEALSQQLDLLAHQDPYGGSKSAVITQALTLLMEGSTTGTVIDALHEHVARSEATLLAQVQDVPASLKAVQHELAQLRSALQETDRRLGHRLDGLVGAFDRLSGRTAPARPQGLLQRLWLALTA
jgi:hypothetical protein